MDDRKQEYKPSVTEAVSSSNNDIPVVPDKNNYLSHEDDPDDNERAYKSKVISLRKPVKKSYDDLPELGKLARLKLICRKINYIDYY